MGARGASPNSPAVPRVMNARVAAVLLRGQHLGGDRNGPVNVISVAKSVTGARYAADLANGDRRPRPRRSSHRGPTP